LAKLTFPADLEPSQQPAPDDLVPGTDAVARSPFGSLLNNLLNAPEQTGAADAINDVLSLVRSAMDVDFTHYKQTTVTRRIRRRLALRDCHNLDEYLQLLRRDRAEICLQRTQACQRAFDDFFTTKVHGTGLGMTICKRFIEKHGGRITVGECAAPGAVVLITLPRGPGG
jgi:nitrogen-specific signal transduction histidine kinase